MNTVDIATRQLFLFAPSAIRYQDDCALKQFTIHDPRAFIVREVLEKWGELMLLEYFRHESLNDEYLLVGILRNVR